VHQTDEIQAQTLKTLTTQPFNKIRYCVFPKWYKYNHTEPTLFAFKKAADGKKFDFTQPDPAFWQHFEKQLMELQKLGIEADIILWHPYDHWGFGNMGAENDDRYLRYCIARLSAYRNVWWSLANEWNFTNKKLDAWDRLCSILQNEDPHQRLRSVHNGGTPYDYTKPWISHASYQQYDTFSGMEKRAKWGKPVIYDECSYEGNIPEGYGRISAELMIERITWATFSGIYATHGECFIDPNDVLWWGKGGTLKGDSPRRIAFLKDVMAKAPPFDELKPSADLTLTKDGEYYAIFCKSAGGKSVELAGTRQYKVEILDINQCTVTPAGTAAPGKFSFTAGKGDLIYRFTPADGAASAPAK
jgi:hypothetical protein